MAFRIQNIRDTTIGLSGLTKGATVMAKVFSLHMIGLRPGVKGEDFERFFREKAVPRILFQGWKTYLLKGDRGDREGKYLLMIETDNEARERYFPMPDVPSEEAQQIIGSVQDVFEEWASL